MKLSENIAQQLKKLNYNATSLDELFLLLPDVIIAKTGVSMRRIPTIYLIKVENNMYTLSLMINDEQNEPQLLQKGTSKNLLDVIGKMILYLDKSGLMDGD